MRLKLNFKGTTRRATGISIACLLVVASVAFLPVHAQEAARASDWDFAATVYGWLPDIGGHTEFPSGAAGAIDVDINTILDRLEMTAQGSFEVHKGRWGGFTDIVYLDVGDSNSRTRDLSIGGVPIPAAVTAATGIDLKSTIWTLAGSYRLAGGNASTFDLIAGARLSHMKQNLSWTFAGNFGSITPPPLTGSAETSVKLWDGIVGGRGRLTLGANQKWSVPYYFDIGAGDSDLTWQTVLGLTYSFRWGDLGVVWRYLDYDLKSSGPIKDINFNGPAAGISLHW